MKQFDAIAKSLGGSFECIGAVSGDEIARAEKSLSLRFPVSLRDYLTRYGAISYKHIEIFGLGVPEGSYVHIVTRTEELRDEQGFPANAVAIEDLGDGHFAVCVSEGGVYEWSSPRESGTELPLLAADFASYLVERLRPA